MPTQHIEPRDFFIEDIFDGVRIGWRIDWPAYHAACDARDARAALTVIDGGKRAQET